jgi:DNA polymerase IV
VQGGCHRAVARTWRPRWERRATGSRHACQGLGVPDLRAGQPAANITIMSKDAADVRSAERAIIHVDMDAFYASVEQRDRPALKGRPVIVGGHARRGVVLAASYEVRRFGVRSAMPMAEALRRAPDAVVVPPRFEAYVAASEDVFAILERVTPLVEPLSLDEAFLDVTASRELFGEPGTIAKYIRAEIARTVNLPASAGIAGVKFVAKIASDVAKPNGQCEVPLADTVAFLAPLPIARLWGVGAKTEAALRAMGIGTIGDLAACDVGWLTRRLPGARGLWDLGQGIDPRPVVPDRAAQSIGAEDTFDEDRRPADLSAHIHAQALRVARRLRRGGVTGRVVQLKVKLSDFTLITRRGTLAAPTDDGQVIYATAIELLARVQPPGRVRLTGVSVQHIEQPSAQLGMFVPVPGRAQLLNAALDRIADRFGDDAVIPADIKNARGPGRDRR